MYSVDVDYCGRQEIKQRGSCAACPILLWSLACSLLEDAYEVGWVVESNLVGNLFAWRILCDEHELRFLYFLFVDVLQRRCSEMLSEQAYEVRCGRACDVGKLVDGDIAANVGIDESEHLAHAFVESPLLRLSLFEKTGDEHEDGAAQPHLLPQGHAVVSFHVVDKSCGVVVRLRVALRQHGLWMICAHAFEKCGIDVVGFHLGGKIVMLKEVSLAFESLVDMKIVMAENAVALV